MQFTLKYLVYTKQNDSIYIKIRGLPYTNMYLIYRQDTFGEMDPNACLHNNVYVLPFTVCLFLLLHMASSNKNLLFNTLSYFIPNHYFFKVLNTRRNVLKETDKIRIFFNNRNKNIYMLIC